MSERIPRMDIEKTKLFAEAVTGTHVHNLTPLDDGENSQAYFFNTAKDEQILRINPNPNVFYKDEILQQYIDNSLVPVPQVLQTGTTDEGLAFAVSERASGKPLNQYTEKEIEVIVPDIIRVLEDIHNTQPFGEGYGWWGIEGSLDGNAVSWHAWLTLRLQQDQKFPEIQSATFYDEPLHEAVKSKINDLLAYCPEERMLLHNDFSYPNILSDGTKLTAVIDWANSIYGDPLKDIATLDYRHPTQAWDEIFKQYYNTLKRLPKYYDERIACYKLFTGLGSLEFCARTQQLQKYYVESTKLAQLL